MLITKKTYLNWSSGKDSALALYYLLQDNMYRVEYLLTSINSHYQRVTMHGLREELLNQQMKMIGIPYGKVELPENPSNEEYEKRMGEKVRQLQSEGFECSAFGDIFLEDLKRYREQQLTPLGFELLFPIWKKNTHDLMLEFINLGFRAIVVAINAELLDKSFVGRELDRDFLNDLPEGVDPCGENGEFHTFCYDAPYFKNSVPFTIGEKVLKEYTHGKIKTGFWFCDLLPVKEPKINP